MCSSDLFPSHDTRGDKTESNLTDPQAWIIQIDSLGNRLWDKTIFTTDQDLDAFVCRTTHGCYAMAITSRADTGGYKTQPEWNHSYDYWTIKFCSSVPLFISSDTTLCEKFCTNFTDQSINNPTSWEWIFPSGTPSSSTDQNPTMRIPKHSCLIS